MQRNVKSLLLNGIYQASLSLHVWCPKGLKIWPNKKNKHTISKSLQKSHGTFFYRPCVLSNIQLELGCPAASSSVILLCHFSSFCLIYMRKVWAGTCDAMHSLSGGTGIWDHSTQSLSVTFLLNSVSICSRHLTLTMPLRTM